MKKPVILLTTGTRGDLQPYMALALALQETGIPVRLASDPAFGKWAAQYNLPFVPVQGNPSALMVRPGSHSALTYDGNLLRSLAASLHYVQTARPIFRQMLHSAWTACQGARAVVVGLPTLWGTFIAEALGVPCINALMQPISRTSAFQCSLLPIHLPNWAPLNRFSYFLIEQAIWQPWRTLMSLWMRNELHLPPASLKNPATKLYEKGAKVLYAISSRIVARPKDWPVNHRMTGFWFLDPAPDWHPPEGLVDFLAAGKPPIYIGFGSAGPGRQRVAVKAITQVLEQTAIRAVIQLPQAIFPPTMDSRRVYFVGDIPHVWLFSRSAGAVHQGGAGTTAAALRAGIPSLVVPLAVDQFFWANRLQSLHAGTAPIPQRSLDGGKLIGGLRKLVDDPALAENARRLSATLQKEGGARQAAALIKNYL